jgi:NTP pyrophosphatase (non-canonical NTP hydrolase)
MEFSDLVERAMDIRQRYAKLERIKYGRVWTREDIALGFVGDVGDLAKLVMAHGGVRDIPDAEAKLAHELADCLWSILVLAHLYNVDLEREFLQTMDGLALHIASQSKLPPDKNIQSDSL